MIIRCSDVSRPVYGGVAGVRERLDLFGVPVLSFAAAGAGGSLR